MEIGYEHSAMESDSTDDNSLSHGLTGGWLVLF